MREKTPLQHTTDLTATNSQIGTAAQITGSPNAVVHQVNIAANNSPVSSAIVAGAVKFGQLAEMMLGPAAGELAEMWRDQVRAYRYDRQLKCLQKAEKMAMDAGFTPRAVPIKLLFPLLEGASMEEDENLHDMWAALLTNASSPDTAGLMRPGFIHVLRMMRRDEAAVLDWFYTTLYARGGVHPEGIAKGALTLELVEILASFKPLGLAKGFSTDGPLVVFPQGIEPVTTRQSTLCIGCIDSLKSQGLIHQLDSISVLSPYTKGGSFCGTYRGYEFFTACQQPKSQPRTAHER